MHISGSIGLISLTWVSLKDLFLLQTLSFWSKIVRSEMEERPVGAGTGINGLTNVSKTNAWQYFETVLLREIKHLLQIVFIT